jgi:hypothetical protein
MKVLGPALSMICALSTALSASGQPPAPGADGLVLKELRQVCAALAANDPGACAELGAPARDRCLAYASSLPMLRAYAARDPAFPALCRDTARRMKLGRDYDEIYDEICGRWWSFTRNPEPLRQAVTAAYSLEEPTKSAVLQIVGEMTLDPRACAKIEDPAQRRICLQFVEYRSAFAAKSAARCHGGLCRMMMGGGAAACNGYDPLPGAKKS